MQTLCPKSGLLQIGQKFEKQQWRHNFLTWRHRQFFWRCFVSLVNFSYCSKFHVNIITGFGVMTIFFYKGLTRNLEIGNTPFWVLFNIWRLGQVMDTKFSRNVSNRMLLNAAKCQGYSVYRFWVIKGKPTGGVKLPPPSPLPPRLGLKNILGEESHLFAFLRFVLFYVFYAFYLCKTFS